jgi:hypothetical protein
MMINSLRRSERSVFWNTEDKFIMSYCSKLELDLEFHIGYSPIGRLKESFFFQYLVVKEVYGAINFVKR